jgi:hypothetical protein
MQKIENKKLVTLVTYSNFLACAMSVRPDELSAVDVAIPTITNWAVVVLFLAEQLG